MTIEEATKVIKTERECVSRNDGINCDRMCDVCDLVLKTEDILTAYDMAVSALVQTRWILVSERLPKENGRYLVTRGLNACGALWNRLYIINYSDLMGLKSERIWWDGNVGKSDFKRIDDAIAWMPLPEPYKKESEEQYNGQGEMLRDM